MNLELWKLPFCHRDGSFDDFIDYFEVQFILIEKVGHNKNHCWKYIPVLDLYFCNEEQIVVLKNRSDKSDWLAQMKCTRKHRILRIPVQLLAEIGTGCFANSRGAIHTSSANAITEIVILTSTLHNLSF